MSRRLQGFSPAEPRTKNNGKRVSEYRDIEINGCVSTILINMIRRLKTAYKLYSSGIFRQPTTSRMMKSVTTAQFKRSINVKLPERRV